MAQSWPWSRQITITAHPFFHSISSGLMEGLELDISPSNLIFFLAITSFSICLIPASSLKRSATHHQWLCYQFFFAQSHISLSSSWYPSLKSIPKCFLCLISCCWNSTIPVHIIVITIFSFLFLSLCVSYFWWKVLWSNHSRPFSRYSSVQIT